MYLCLTKERIWQNSNPQTKYFRLTYRTLSRVKFHTIKDYNKTVNGGQLLNQIYLEDISTIKFHNIYSSEERTSVISKI